MVDELKLTQEFIAEMLGTRRSGVSEAAMMLIDADGPWNVVMEP